MKESYFIDEEDLVFRRASENDNFNEIASLIYDTNKYMYPFWFNSKEEAIDVLSKLISEEGSIFNYNNMYVCYNNLTNQIIGMVNAIDNTINLNFDYDKIASNDNTSITINSYIKPLIENVLSKKNKKYMFIPCICVNDKYRSKGIGTKLMGYFINQMEGSGFEEFELNCFINNLRAKNLFHSMGFKEIKTIKGFDGNKDSKILEVVFLRKKGNNYLTDFEDMVVKQD